MSIVKTQAQVEIFSGRVFHSYQVESVFLPAMADYYGADKVGETLNVPQFPKRRAVNKPDGEAHANASYTLTAVEVPWDDPLKRWEFIEKDKFETRPDLGLFTNTAEEMGMSLAVARNIRLAGCIAKAASDAGNELVMDALGTGFGDRFAAKLRELAATMDNDGVPHTGRYVMCTPTLFRELRAVTPTASTDFGGWADGQRPRPMVWHQGFMVMALPGFFGTDFTGTPYASDNIPASQAFDATNAVAIGFHNRAWCWRDLKGGIERVGPHFLADYDHWKLEYRAHYGVRARNSEGLWLISDDGT